MHQNDPYVLQLGKFWANFNSLEFLLRIAIAKLSKHAMDGLEGKPGDEFQENPINNWDTFGALCKKYNQLTSKPLVFDDLIILRDTLAHGRVTSPIMEMPLTVVKFSKPQKGKVTIENKVVLTTKFLGDAINSLFSLITNVSKDAT